MSGPGATITITLETLAEKATTALNGFFGGIQNRIDTVKNLNKELENGSAAVNQMTAAIGALIGLGALKGFVEQAISGARANAQFAAALRSSGQQSDQYVQQLQGQRKALSELTGVRQGEIRDVQRTLIQFGVQQEQMPALTGLTLDYAAAMGMDGASAAQMLGRALQGQEIVLRGLRLQLDKTLPKAQQLAELEEILARKVGGQAQAMREAEGPIVDFNLRLEESKKALGAILLNDLVTPFFKGLTQGFDVIKEKLESFNKENPLTVSSIKAISEEVGSLLGKLIPTIAAVAATVVGIRAMTFAFGQVKAAGIAARVGIAWIFGSDVVGVLAMVRSLKDLRAGLALILEQVGPGTAIAGAGAAGWIAGRLIGNLNVGGSTLDQKVQDWFRDLFFSASDAVVDVGANALERTILKTIASGKESGKLSQATADGFKNQAIQIRTASQSASEYEDKLHDLAIALRAALNPKSETVDPIAADFQRRSELLAREKAAAISASQTKTGLASIELDDAINESAYKRGLVSLEQYLAKRSTLIEVVTAEEKIPLQKTLDVITSQLEEKTRALNDLADQNNKTLSAGGVPDFTQQLELQKQVDDLQVKIKELDAALSIVEAKRKKAVQDTSDFADKGSFKGGIQSWLNDVDKQPSFGAQAATSFKNTWTSAIDGVSSSFSGLIMGTKTWGQTVIAIGNTAATALVENFVKLGVEWVNTHVLMAAVSKLFHAAETADTVAHTTAQVGIHTAGESSKTAATGIQVFARNALRLGETLYHGLQVVLRTGAHILGEVAMTAASLVQSLVRRVAAFLEAQPYIFLAAVKAATAVADIPYVGPILAPIAAATTFAALEALAVFREGGYTGDGPPDQVAGLVHRGEVVIPAERVQQTGVGRLMQFVRSGRFSPSDADINSSAGAGGGSGAGGATIQHKTNLSLAMFGGEADAKRWAEGQDGETWFLNQMDKHAYKYQR